MGKNEISGQIQLLELKLKDSSYRFFSLKSQNQGFEYKNHNCDPSDIANWSKINSTGAKIFSKLA